MGKKGWWGSRWQPTWMRLVYGCGRGNNSPRGESSGESGMDAFSGEKESSTSSEQATRLRVIVMVMRNSRF